MLSSRILVVAILLPVGLFGSTWAGRCLQPSWRWCWSGGLGVWPSFPGSRFPTIALAGAAGAALLASAGPGIASPARPAAGAIGRHTYHCWLTSAAHQAGTDFALTLAASVYLGWLGATWYRCATCQVLCDYC
jgi:hypothetical protein